MPTICLNYKLQITNYKKNPKLKYQISKTSANLKDIFAVLNFELGFDL